MRIKAPQGWDLELWREAKETGIDLLLVHENPDFELVIEPNDKGVRSTGPDKEKLKIMHYSCIKGLTEPNPLWTGEWCEKPMVTKPKDMGFEVHSGPTRVTIGTESIPEQRRLQRCRSALVRSIIHAFVAWRLSDA